MNERIRELYIQSLNESENIRWNIEDAEKFAKLIVLECARKIDDMIDNGWYADTEELKKHFGVE